MLYLWLKWGHLVGVISWMAGILYLLRLFVYHLDFGFADEKFHEKFCMMEKRLTFIITKPAMTVAWLCGLGMIYVNPGVFAMKWLHAKIGFVLLLTLVTIYANILRKSFAKKEPLIRSSRKLRLLNEVPSVIMMGVLFLAVFRPF